MVEFFSNPLGNEGKKFIGKKRVETNENGNTGAFTFRPDLRVRVGDFVTATATNDSTGDTSEFSVRFKVQQT